MENSKDQLFQLVIELQEIQHHIAISEISLMQEDFVLRERISVRQKWTVSLCNQNLSKRSVSPECTYNRTLFPLVLSITDRGSLATWTNPISGLRLRSNRQVSQI